MNKMWLTGRITKHIELRYTNSSMEVCQFSLAVTRNFKNSEGEYDTDLINCVAYNHNARMMSDYLKKGDKIGVAGRLQTRTYQNSEGKNVYISEVIVDNIEFLEAKKEKNASNEEVRRTNTSYEEDPFADLGGSITIDDNFLD